MQEHPIPQDITGYQFHLIGSMTIRQFAMVLAGVVAAVVFYQVSLPVFMKLPISIMFALTGAGAAFVPIEGRPLDQWIVNFFRALYKPTKFFWKREAQIPDAFTYEAKNDKSQEEKPVGLGPVRKERVQEFLRSMNQAHLEVDQFDYEENMRINQVLQTFDDVSVEEQEGVKQVQKPDLKVRVRKMQAIDGGRQRRVVFDAGQAQKDAASIDKEAAFKPERAAFNGSAETVSQNQDLPFPNKPSQPNKIVGMVLEPSNRLIKGARVEIKNEQGETITAVKSNALGQFFVTMTGRGIATEGRHLLHQNPTQGLRL